MTIKASGSLGLSTDIVTEFTSDTGKNMGSLRGVTWYKDGVLDTGTFSATNLSFSSFYSKRATDPASAGSQIYNTASDNTFIVPIYRNNINFYAWGGGGGCGGPGVGGTGGTTTVTLPSATLTAVGGQGGGGGARRSVGPAGAGGGQSGGTIGENGASGSSANKGPGGNAGGVSYGGGAGGTNAGGNYTGYPGNAPGGGGSAWFGYDGSPDPGFSGGGGAGGAGFSGYAYTAGQLAPGTSINIHVGDVGSSANSGPGGVGQVKITWS
jgi:hypothetical protein